MTVVFIIRTAFEVLNWLIIIRVLLSWIRHDPYHPVIKFIYEITEPVLAPFRRLIPMRPGMPIDFSPFLAILILQFIEHVILNLFY
ncbi:YggT family protein [Candidatus Formimonas warabiya]|uniref:YggT family protein n=1 Tax=Formimonas warabiya TaxID=1761012 RepID=A0A3G1KR80_FORW1|nr:YggT family protein [Candidatus Formimonas warabiya]ATW24947.1 YggT family protein [Candidatus Formimonas warabiya]